MIFESVFEQRLETLHREGRYRVFADLKRRCGFFPVADHFAANGPREVTVHALDELWAACPVSNGTYVRLAAE